MSDAGSLRMEVLEKFLHDMEDRKEFEAFLVEDIGEEKFVIRPFRKSGKSVQLLGSVYDNLDEAFRVIMDKNEMIMEFKLIFGYDVEFEYDESNGLRKIGR